jgi:hypothetical protein
MHAGNGQGRRRGSRGTKKGSPSRPNRTHADPSTPGNRGSPRKKKSKQALSNGAPATPPSLTPTVAPIPMRVRQPRDPSATGSLASFQRRRPSCGGGGATASGGGGVGPLVSQLHQLLDELKRAAVEDPSGATWESFRQIMEHMLHGTSGFAVPQALLPLNTLTPGAIVDAVRGTLGRDARVSLQVLSEISVDGGILNLTVSDGEFSQFAQCWYDDKVALEETGKFGTLECTAVWLSTEGCLLLRNVTSQLNAIAMIGNPPLFQPARPRAPAPLLPPSTTGVSGLRVGVVIPGTADCNTTVNRVPAVTCRGACKICPITTSEGYVEAAPAAQTSEKCVALAFPPPDFDRVKDAPRGTDRQLDGEVTNRVRRYAL